MKYQLCALLAVLAVGCGAAPTRQTVVRHAEPRAVLQFHGDVDFTFTERALIAQAISDLQFQTAGMYRLGVTYDLDFKTDLTRWADVPWLVSAQSTYPWIEIIELLKANGGHLLGVTLRDPGKAPQVYLVMDRLESPVMMRHVTMHELLHSAGLHDLPALGSVMSGATSPADPRVCLTPADRVEFCRVWKCQVEELNGCDW